MPTAAVIPALGIGDALLMMIASHQLQLHGYQVTTFHSQLPELSSWLPGHNLQSVYDDDLLESYDLLIVENNNSPMINRLIEKRRSRLSIFYPTYKAGKHAPLTPLDRRFDPHLSMAANISIAIASLLNATPSKENGLVPPPCFTHHSYKNRVLIHPTSRVPAKNWKAEGFFKVAKEIAAQGLEPVFCVAPSELKEWENREIPLANASSLADLAGLIYESRFVIGNDSLPGHLASNLGIPTLIIADSEERMRLWRPDWLQGELVFPSRYLPKWKFLRMRWQQCITAAQVLKAFNRLQEVDYNFAGVQP